MSNPATNLVEMLDRIFNQRKEKTVREAWAIEFNVKPSDTASIFFLLAKVNQTLEDVKLKLTSMPGFDSSIILDPLSDLGTAICFPNIDTPVGSIAHYYNEQAKLSLKIASSYYTKQEIQPHIPADQLEEIKSEIESLFNYINECDMNQELRCILLDFIETMRRAVAEFQIRGNQSLQDVLDQSLGRLIRASRQTTINVTEDPGFSKAIALLTLIDKAICVAERAAPYLTYLGTLVPALSMK
ncbi:hypothetical protein [Geothrix alkalitolerans]|uniref:hypothetical protein n=1 Tax=Geothrix alkalitolerans TaxID=2922724 RepID=UPI001FAE9020|nr:hypothetical protein [Geothrix alkalitolerans]